MDLEAAKLLSGNICRYTMIAALGCLLLAALILVRVSLSSNPMLKDDVALNEPSSQFFAKTRLD